LNIATILRHARGARVVSPVRKPALGSGIDGETVAVVKRGVAVVKRGVE
jgi:hypothetical protein